MEKVGDEGFAYVKLRLKRARMVERMKVCIVARGNFFCWKKGGI